MFCPYCGAKNEPPGLACFICGKVLPSLTGKSDAAAAPGRPGRPGRPEAAAAVRPGAIGDRMLALGFDRALLVALGLIAAAALAERLGLAGSATPPGVGMIIGAFSVFSVTVFVYHVLLEASVGTTLGKAIMGLQVRNESDRNTFIAAAIRNALRVLDGQALYVVGFLVALFSRRGRRIGDMVAQTIVLEQTVPRFARAILLIVWLATIVVSVWIAWTLCPDCRVVVGPQPAHPG